jgi:hypothetical protein
MTVMTMHESLIQVVQWLDASIALILIGLGVLYIVQERHNGSVAARTNVTVTADQRVAELVRSR